MNKLRFSLIVSAIVSSSVYADHHKDQIESSFYVLDSNSNGYLSEAEANGNPISEYIAHYQKQPSHFDDSVAVKEVAPKKVSMAFVRLDANSDGFLVAEEISTHDFSEHFDKIDIDSDGKISQREFNSYSTKISTITKSDRRESGKEFAAAR